MAKKQQSSHPRSGHDHATELDQMIQLGIECYRAGDMDSTRRLLDHVLSISPHHPEALHYMGLMAFHHDQREPAVALITHALSKMPDSYDMHYNLGQIYDSMVDKTAEAISCFETARALKPDFIAAITRLGHAYTRMKRYREAIHLYTETLKRHPESSALHTRTGMLLYELQMPHAALPFFKKSIAIDQTNTVSRLYLCECLKATGDLEAARMHAQDVLSIDPENIHALCSLSETEKFPPEHPAFSFLENQTNNLSLSERIRSGILFALGKMYADTADFDRSFERYRRGNELRKEYSGRFDRNLFVKRLEVWKDIFTREYFAERDHFGIDSTVPVFIVGMPRSGTSLIEQILASHSMVHGAGELKEISFLAATLCDVEKKFETAKHITRTDVRKAAEKYLSYIGTLSSTAVHVVDKMPGNQFYLWAIALMFPRARIIYCRRNPLDNCVACFVKNFTERHLYANDLADLGFFYAHSSALMEHWKMVLPLRVLDVEYESVVTDLQQNIERLLGFCELPWEDTCLEFYKTERKVLTASRVQVRKKLYSSSINRHTMYQQYLRPLVSELREGGIGV